MPSTADAKAGLYLPGHPMSREQTLMQIVSALEYLKGHALQVGEAEVAALIGATFDACLDSYVETMRQELMARMQ